MPENMQQGYEWVLVIEDAPDIVLTEKQFEVYKTRVQNGEYTSLFVDDAEIRPYHVVTSFKRPAEIVKKKYPCKPCMTNGFLLEKDEKGVFKLCPECKGTGIDKDRS